MQNDQGPKQPVKKEDEALTTPHPPKNVESSPEPEGVALVPPAQQMPSDMETKEEMGEKVQDRDWNNGRPEVTRDDVPPLQSHQNPEKENEESLRKNKGNKEGEEPFEASEEVNTGQSGG